ncbi:MAG: MFS transporter [Epsilonproteobacteria bacterium]|nr:MFS transporter [Campylobacterota bacterium]
MDYPTNNRKNVLHGFFLSMAMAIAEPATTLPLIVQHFGGSPTLVGLFGGILRSGALLVPIFAAFWTQERPLVLPGLRRVFLIRFASWLVIGIAILTIPDPTVVLVIMGAALALFSLSAGFGMVYFQELLAKLFDPTQRGRTMANRQLFSALGSMLSGLLTGLLLSLLPPPTNYGLLFTTSALLMAIGFLAFATIHEPPKREINPKESSLAQFLAHLATLVAQERTLRLHLATITLGYGFLLPLNFTILHAQETFQLSGWMVGGLTTVQMGGALVANLFYKRLAPAYGTILRLALLLLIAAFSIPLTNQTWWSFTLAFALVGMGIDGFRIGATNLLLAMAPPAKRPIYIALQSTSATVTLLLAPLGGWLLPHIGYEGLYLGAICLLAGALGLSIFIHPPRL